MSADRRASTRRKVSLAAELETGEGRRAVAVSRDASESGILLLTHLEPPLATEFRLFILRPSETEPSLELRGRVVRSEKLELEYADVWSYKVAVELIDPPANLGAILDEVAAAMDV